MIVFDTKHYRIEKCNNTPKPYALDRKEQYQGHVCLVNVGWFYCQAHASTAMAKDVLANLKEESDEKETQNDSR
jgi:hypothetical protein